MSKKFQHILLSEASKTHIGAKGERLIRVLSSIPSAPAEAGKQTWVTVTRTGTFTDPRYGSFAITRDMLLSMVGNFDKRVVGTEIFLDVSHRPNDGAAAKILRLSIEGERLRALVESTAFGVQAVRDRGFTYLSAEYHENWQDNEVGATHGAVLLGAGLTVRPVIKRLDPVTLSCESGKDNVPILVHPELAQQFINEANNTMTLSEILAAITAMNLNDKAKAEFKALATKQLEDVTDPAKAKALGEGIVASAKALAESAAPSPAPTPVDAPAPATDPVTLSEEQVAQIVRKQLDDAHKTAANQVVELAAKRKLSTDVIDAAAGLDDDLKKELSEGIAPFINGSMSDEQVRQLAEHQIAHGNKIVAARELSGMGFGTRGAPVGSPHISVIHDDAKKLSGIYIDHLKQSSSASLLMLDEKKPLHPFCEKILSEYDRLNGAHLNHELKVLAGSATDMASTSLPYSVQREVIRQALSDLNVLTLVQNLTDFSAQATTQIPFETRDMSQIINDGVVYERKPIPNAGVSQGMETAFVTPMKIALSISNEVMYFTRSSQLNWDALGRNIEMNARIIKEMVHRRICNELQRANDSYLAVTVSNEAFTASLGAKNYIKTVGFPVVRMYQPRDLQGTAQGTLENPITVVLNSVTCLPYDGSGNQAAGTYYRVTSYNLGLVQFVNQAGVPVVPAATGTNTISYSRATNLQLWDQDFNTSTTTNEKNLNKLIQAIGSRKAMMKAQRFVTPDYLLMSPSLNDSITNAEQFIVSLQRDGSNTSRDGDLEAVKSIPAFGTNAPGIDLGDERIQMGVRNVTAYTVVKPYASSELIESIDSTTGRPIGKKVAYGEEYNAIVTPKAVRDRSTAIVVYSSSARAAL